MAGDGAAVYRKSPPDGHRWGPQRAGQMPAGDQAVVEYAPAYTSRGTSHVYGRLFLVIRPFQSFGAFPSMIAFNMLKAFTISPLPFKLCAREFSRKGFPAIGLHLRRGIYSEKSPMISIFFIKAISSFS